MSHSLPHASIVIPFLNASDTIVRCLESVLRQTNDSWECILIDDGSEDNTQSKIKQFLTDPRFRLISNPINLGVSSSRNLGAKLARSSYAIVLDADDEASPDRVHRTICTFEANESLTLFAGACSQFEVNDSYSGSETDSCDLPRSSTSLVLFDKHNLIFGCPFVHSTVAYRKDLFFEPSFISYNPSYLVAHDYDLYRQVGSAGYSIGYVQDSLCIRHETGKGLMNRMSKRMVAESVEIKAKCISEMFPTIGSNISNYISLMLTYTKFISGHHFEACDSFIRSDVFKRLKNEKIKAMLNDRFKKLLQTN